MPSLATRKEEDPRVLFLFARLRLLVCDFVVSLLVCDSRSPVTCPLVSRPSVLVTGLRLR